MRASSRPALFPRFVVVGAASVLATTFALSFVFESSARRMLAEAATEGLRSSATLFERLHASYYPSLLLLDRDPAVADYLSYPAVTKETALRALEAIDAAASENDLIHSIYLYRRDAGVLSTRHGWEPMSSVSDPGFDGFVKGIRKSELGRYLPRCETFEGDLSSTNLLTLAFGVVPEGSAGMRKALVVNLRADRIRKLLAIPGSTSDLVIVSSDSKIVSHADPSLFGRGAEADPRIAACGGEAEGSGKAALAGVRWLSAWIARPETGWRFISFSREDLVFGPIKRIRNAISLVAAAALGLVSLFSVLASRGFLRRLRRDELLAAYLCGLVDLQEAERDAGGQVLRGRGPYRAAIARLGGLRSLEARLGSHAARELRDEALAAARDEGGASFACSLGSGEILILYQGSEAESLASLESLALALEARLGMRLGWRAEGRPKGRLGDGSALLLYPEPRSEEGLPEACRLLLEGSRAAFRLGPGGARLYDGAVDDPGEDVDFDGPALASFEAGLLAGEGEEARTALEALLRAAAEDRASEASFRALVSGLVLRCARALREDSEALLPGGAVAFRRSASAAESIEEVRALFAEVCAAACKRSELHAGERRREICARARRIVDERLRDRSLGTAAVADAVGLSPHYLRELFRQVEGTSVMQYIGKARVEESKRLLRETDRPLRELYADAGFIGYSYFFTYFKKATGVTPSEYRESARRSAVSAFQNR
jgi:AraC-like DNA-binding protein